MDYITVSSVAPKVLETQGRPARDSYKNPFLPRKIRVFCLFSNHLKMKFLSLSLLSISALSACVSAGPLAAIDQLRVFRSEEPELRLVQYGYDDYFMHVVF